jgi:hypothetical protein
MLSVKTCQLGLLLVLVGCSTQPKKVQVDDRTIASAQGLQCHHEEITGSMVGRTVCTDQADRNAQQHALDDFRRQVTAPTATCIGAEKCAQ